MLGGPCACRHLSQRHGDPHRVAMFGFGGLSFGRFVSRENKKWQHPAR